MVVVGVVVLVVDVLVVVVDVVDVVPAVDVVEPIVLVVSMAERVGRDAAVVVVAARVVVVGIDTVVGVVLVDGAPAPVVEQAASPSAKPTIRASRFNWLPPRRDDYLYEPRHQFGSRWQNRHVDPESLSRFARGDERALAELYDEFGAAVFTVALSILRDIQLAEDATQQTFAKAWAAASSYDPERPFSSWIYSIARRTAIDIWRAESRRRRSRTVDESEIAEMPPGLESTWERFEVRRALEALTPEEREVVRLTHYEGYTHSQVAELLEISIGTVKSRSHRAHRRLAQALEHLIDE